MKIAEIENNPILKLTLDFAVQLSGYCDQLESEKKYVVARQLLRCGTSIGANSMEAQNAESRNDFIHKIKIAAKEANETQYWLFICQRSHSYPSCDLLQQKLEDINRILNSILGTAKRNSPSTTQVK
jgi:four helix bundle protein